MKPYLPYAITALQILGIGLIATLIGALGTRLRATTIKNVRPHALFVSTILSMLGLAAVVSSRLFVGRSALDTTTWFFALWFFNFFLFWCGFKICIAGVHQDFGDSSILSMQHLDETRLPTKGDDLTPHHSERPATDAHFNRQGELVQGKRPTR
jgi:hypothetical protein